MARFLKREAFVRVGASPKPKSSKPRLKTKSVRVQESPISPPSFHSGNVERILVQPANPLGV